MKARPRVRLVSNALRRHPYFTVSEPHGVPLVLTALCLLAGFAAGAYAESRVRMVVTPFKDATFVPVDANQPNGAQVAVLWGDPTRSPSAVMLKFVKAPGRTQVHTSD